MLEGAGHPREPHARQNAGQHQHHGMGVVQGAPGLQRVQVVAHGERHAGAEAKRRNKDDLPTNDGKRQIRDEAGELVVPQED